MKSMVNTDKKNRIMKDNRGFSLVELLVAIAILSVIIVPTLQVFVASTKTTSKSKMSLQATITAESVLESAKAFNIGVIDTQCNATYNATNAKDFVIVSGTTANSFVSSVYGGNVGTVEFETDGTIKRVWKDSAKFAGREKQEKYAYAFNGIQQSGIKYDAVVVFVKDGDSASRDLTNGSGGTLVTAGTAASVAESNDSVYNYKYKITVYVYKHSETPAYIGKNPATDSGVLVTLEGSKLDSATLTEQ